MTRPARTGFATTSRLTRLGLVLSGVPALLLAAAATASAHVTVNPDSAPAGGYSKLTFKVPNESDSASTTRLQIFLPTDQPLEAVSVQPRPGWTYEVKKAELTKPLTDHDGNKITQAVSEVNWTADSAATAIKPGEFDEFNISVGPLPDSGTMTFKALQTYSDGSVARWIDEDESGDKPAPTLTLADAGGATGETVGAGHHDQTENSEHAAAAETPEAASKTPLVLSIIAIVIAVLGAVLGAGLGVLRRRS